MEAKKKYVKPAFRFVTDLGSILECLYEVYGTDGELLLKGEKLSDTVICPFVRMVQKKCSVVDAEILHLMLWKIYMVSARKEWSHLPSPTCATTSTSTKPNWKLNCRNGNCPARRKPFSYGLKQT